MLGGSSQGSGQVDLTPRCMNPAVSGGVDPTQVRVMVGMNDKDRDIPAVQRAISIQQQHHINGTYKKNHYKS